MRQPAEVNPLSPSERNSIPPACATLWGVTLILLPIAVLVMELATLLPKYVVSLAVVSNLIIFFWMVISLSIGKRAPAETSMTVRIKTDEPSEPVSPEVPHCGRNHRIVQSLIVSLAVTFSSSWWLVLS